MSGTSTARHSQNLVDKPERIGPALGQVVSSEDGRDVILGQCWVGAPNQLITCGHVVDRFVQNLGGLFVYFPSSGKRYPVQRIVLHPSFVRQPDGLVKFDAAVLSVNLSPPDSLALPLPFSYENALRTNQPLWTIRYPVHLGQLSAALQPLSQDGHFLGLLRKHDNFHVLHDVPLAPGDSGAPISDGKVVVAMHCGDTASIPGLNLPTSSIRLALWVDAFRDLGLTETRTVIVPKASRVLKALGAFTVAFILGLGATMLFAPPKPAPKPVPLEQPVMMPLEIKFNAPLDDYTKDEVVEIYLVPHTPCYPFMFLTDEVGHVVELYPGYGEPKLVKNSVKVDQGSKGSGDGKDASSGSEQLLATDIRLKLYAVALDAKSDASAEWARTQLVANGEFADKDSGTLIIDEKTLVKRLSTFQSKNPDLVFWRVFDVPRPKH